MTDYWFNTDLTDLYVDPSIYKGEPMAFVMEHDERDGEDYRVGLVCRENGKIIAHMFRGDENHIDGIFDVELR